MSSTSETSQEPMSWLKAVVPLNIWRMFVTLPVFHPLIFALNEDSVSNRPLMSVIKLVFQFEIDSYTAAPQSTFLQSQLPSALPPDPKQFDIAVSNADLVVNGPGPSQFDDGPSLLPEVTVFLYLASQAVAERNMFVDDVMLAELHPVMS